MAKRDRRIKDIPKQRGLETGARTSWYRNSIQPLQVGFKRFCLFSSLAWITLLGGCALNEIARKEDIAVAKTDLAEEILKLKTQNRALTERLDTATQQSEEAQTQLAATRSEIAQSVKFLDDKLDKRIAALETSMDQIAKNQEKNSADVAGKVQVILDEVEKENTKIHQRIDRLSQKKTSHHSARTTAVGSSGNQNYTVVPGDTLVKIAKRFKVSVATLLELNGLENPNDVHVGESLIIPETSSRQ